MDWQQLVALAIVAVTTMLMIWGRLRSRRRHCGAGLDCGCLGGSALSEARTDRLGPRLIISSRKGEPPRLRQPLGR